MPSQLVQKLKDKYGVEVHYQKLSEESYMALEIMNFPSGYYYDIIKTMLKQLDVMLCKFSKVLVLRLDLRLEQYSKDNKVVSQFINSIQKKIKNTYGEFAYIWVREQNKADKQHYHIAYFFNGHKIIHPSKVISLIQTGWFKASAGGALYIPEHCFYQLFTNQPNFYDNFKEAVYRLSYLAKCYSKRRVSQSVKNYSSSRLEYSEGS
ncbi:inovirus Gp2 family protein [Pseudoalteromonas sp. 2CM37A]|uniref:YagK/YfjJ domain-containing protein n=1 Tax=Pseudoalteromonas sp. 2CM37A TaxID=2929853 RepID=UPI0020BF304A|nr:inovirus-type Gp2 protein [Pseudoalteromonas sp. 2CM37A]MCK8118499.1 inovirus Gp2 family protein [Pseudoalteromonas sp. 2CM37A]